MFTSTVYPSTDERLKYYNEHNLFGDNTAIVSWLEEIVYHTSYYETFCTFLVSLLDFEVEALTTKYGNGWRRELLNLYYKLHKREVEVSR